MNVCLRAGAVGVGAVALMLAVVSPAAAAPPEEPGCTFDRGMTTCVTTTTESGTVGPITAAGRIGDGTLPRNFCQVAFGRPDDLYSFYRVSGLVLATETTTTTTAVHRGAPGSNGKEISSDTDADTVATRVVKFHGISCSDSPIGPFD